MSSLIEKLVEQIKSGNPEKALETIKSLAKTSGELAAIEEAMRECSEKSGEEFWLCVHDKLGEKLRRYK